MGPFEQQVEAMHESVPTSGGSMIFGPHTMCIPGENAFKYHGNYKALRMEMARQYKEGRDYRWGQNTVRGKNCFLLIIKDGVVLGDKEMTLLQSLEAFSHPNQPKG